ncbi:hypothetical protein BCR42DRAFT_407321 [Absidia repens]|uniref:Uncharacterized protein n=1 Tax=Absidia repens TaxID=90262 RepID=A0A1X2IS12_9FUNG|nr:hypothetical protein BCR42DRAFT_407321 [Absidia repens]
MQIKLNRSQSNPNCAFFSSWFQTLNTQEKEQALFHLQYNPHGCYKYDYLSEPVLAYIIQQDDIENDTKRRHYFCPPSPNQPASWAMQEHTHEYHTRLSRLEHMLECACVNPRMIWKYSFAKSFVLGNGSLLCEEDVVRRIQDSEEEWRLLSRTLKRRLGAL